jgi:hypothetical protein
VARWGDGWGSQAPTLEIDLELHLCKKVNFQALSFFSYSSELIGSLMEKNRVFVPVTPVTMGEM